jgi:hypothetical protein
MFRIVVDIYYGIWYSTFGAHYGSEIALQVHGKLLAGKLKLWRAYA